MEGGILEAQDIHPCTVYQADQDVDSGHSPWVVEVLEDGLVEQVEANVQGVPRERETEIRADGR